MLKFLVVLLAFVTFCDAAFIGIHINSRKDDNNDVVRDSTAGRIVGGETVDIAVHPHQISLRERMTDCKNCIWRHNCGGAIISSTLVVTAAHCIISKVPSQLHVVAGGNQRKSTDGAIAPVKEIIMHEDYDPIHIKNDIALLKLAMPLPLNNFTIKAIELADGEAKEGEIATVSGWGVKLSESGTRKSSDFLQEVKLPIISNELCNKDYSPRIITDDMLCAGVRGVGGKDSCQGDSGGPLVINGKLAGVVSWGRGCATPQYPGVYSKISYFRPWLLEKIAKYQ